VEKKKTLKAAQEAMRGPARDAVRAAPVPAAKKEERKKEKRRPTTNQQPGKNDSRAPKNNGWESTGAALRRVPQNEIDTHKKVKDGCW